MRSYEDRWNWLRAQLEDDAATLKRLEDERTADDKPDRAHIYLVRRLGVETALQHMDDADRNGPVEPL